MNQTNKYWQQRLEEYIKIYKNAHLVSLTINETEHFKLSTEITKTDKHNQENLIIKLAFKRFRERWRKKYKTSIKHWLITKQDIQHKNKIHLYGLLWTDHPEEINKIWQYGFTWKSDYTNQTTIEHLLQSKKEPNSKNNNFKQILLTSPQIKIQNLESLQE